MSALLIVELTVKDTDALKEYSSQTPDILERFGGEVVVKAKPVVLHDSAPDAASHGMMVVFRFPDGAAAQAWYDSAEYQSLIPVRDRAMNSRFRIIA
jgi:uncharacterized protein (DUF1330 family)